MGIKQAVFQELAWADHTKMHIKRQGILRWAGTLGLLSWMLLGCSAWAEDVVVMTSGQTLRGRVKSATAEAVMIALSDGNEITVPRSGILRMSVEPPPSVVRGIEAYEKGNLKEAQLNLSRVMLQYQGLDVDWASKGMIYFGRSSLAVGDYAKAQQAFELFLAGYPEHPATVNAQIGLAAVLVGGQKYAEALTRLRELATRYDKQLKPSQTDLPYAAEIYLSIGKCLEGQSQWAAALEAYLRVVALYPAETFYPEALLRGALMYSALDQPAKALPLLTELINDYPAADCAPQAIAERKRLAPAVTAD